MLVIIGYCTVVCRVCLLTTLGLLRLGMCGKLKIGWDSVLRIRTVHYFDIVQTVFR